MKTTKIQLDKDSGDHYIEFDDETIQELGWEIGDTVEWIDNGDGTWTLRKADVQEKTTD